MVGVSSFRSALSKISNGLCRLDEPKWEKGKQVWLQSLKNPFPEVPSLFSKAGVDRVFQYIKNICMPDCRELFIKEERQIIFQKMKWVISHCSDALGECLKKAVLGQNDDVDISKDENNLEDRWFVADKSCGVKMELKTLLNDPDLKPYWGEMANAEFKLAKGGKVPVSVKKVVNENLENKYVKSTWQLPFVGLFSSTIGNPELQEFIVATCYTFTAEMTKKVPLLQAVVANGLKAVFRGWMSLEVFSGVFTLLCEDWVLRTALPGYLKSPLKTLWVELLKNSLFYAGGDVYKGITFATLKGALIDWSKWVLTTYVAMISLSNFWISMIGAVFGSVLAVAIRSNKLPDSWMWGISAFCIGCLHSHKTLTGQTI